MQNYKTKLAAASALVALLGSQAYAAEVRQCLPTGFGGGEVQLCDATKLNKEFRLQLGENGCAVAQPLPNGDVSVQVVNIQWEVTAAEKEEAAKQGLTLGGAPVTKLPDCDFYQIGAFWIEL